MTAGPDRPMHANAPAAGPVVQETLEDAARRIFGSPPDDDFGRLERIPAPTPPGRTTPAPTLKPTIRERYDEWRRTPDGITVYREARSRALALRQRGWRHYAIRPILEAIRYDRAVQVGPDDGGWKINDHHAPHLARELMEREPVLDGFFELRALRA